MKEKMLRTAREKGQLTDKGKPMRCTADTIEASRYHLSADPREARREWVPIFNNL